VDSLAEAFRPPLLRVMQNTGHYILSPPKKREPTCRTYRGIAIVKILDYLNLYYTKDRLVTKQETKEDY
jgi:hypothetical protein